MDTVKATAYVASKLLVPDVIRYWKYRTKKITVLSLHRVSDEYSLFWPPLPVAVFERLCRYWSRYYQVTTFENLPLALASSKKPLLVLSFDDGYLDFYTHAWPLLKKYNLTANMNIVTGCASGQRTIWTQRLNNAFDALAAKGVTKSLVLDNGYFIRSGSTIEELVKANKDLFKYLRLLKDEERNSFLNDLIRQFGIEEPFTKMMNWEQVIELSKAGVEMGSHTITHDILTSIEKEELLEDEIIHSRQLLEEKLGHQVKVLAFPNGYYNERVLTMAAKAGYQFMLAVNDTFLEHLSMQPGIVVPRILLHHTGYYENKLNTENLFGKLKSYF